MLTLLFYADTGLWQLPYFVMGRVCITVNLLIDQHIILYLLLHEIICLDDENFLLGMCQYICICINIGRVVETNMVSVRKRNIQGRYNIVWHLQRQYLELPPLRVVSIVTS